jgi:hypothetical protein
LTGTVDVSNEKDYSREINLDDAANLLRDRNYINNIALAEAHGNATELKNNLTKIIEKAKIFMANRDEVWDREELKGAIQDIIADCGKFVCLLGGKSTGKSLVLEYLEKRNMGTVFIVDLRVRDKDILKALLTVLETRRDYYVNLDNQTPTIEAVLKAGEVFASVVGKGAAYGQFLTTVTAFMKMNSAKRTLEVLIDGLIKVEGEKITIIIDEANVAFTIKPETKEEKIDAASDALLMFTQLTKQTRKV